MRGGMGGRLHGEVNKDFKLRDLNKKSFAILSSNIKGERKNLIIASLLTLIISATHVVLPILMKTAIDDYIGIKDFTGLIFIVLAYIGLAGVQWLASSRQIFLANLVG